ncbi:hypothetical protein ABIC16_001461 [Sphingomonas sp. PvP055]
MTASVLPVAQPVLVNASRFRAAHAAEWERLDAIIRRIERRSIRAVPQDDLLALPLLYRTALSSLSVARETSLDRALIDYLEQLCTRAYFQLYGVQTSAWTQLRRFFVRGWPAAVQSLWRETLVSFLLTVAGVVVGYLIVRGDAAWFFAIVGDSMAGGRDPSASVETLRKTLYARPNSRTCWRRSRRICSRTMRRSRSSRSRWGSPSRCRPRCSSPITA